MDANGANKKDVTSKIEQLRIDLEKKLAALEKSKQNKLDDVENSIEPAIKAVDDSVINKSIEELIITTPIIKDEVINIEEEIEAEAVFEISDPIEIVDETIDIIPPIIIKNKVVPSAINENEKSNANEIVTPITSIQTFEKEQVINDDSSKNTSDFDNKEEEYLEEDEPKKRKLNFLIYALAGILLLTIGYFLVDYFKDKNDFEKEKMNHMISTFKNKSYLDSIELADANNQLLDYQNQILIDSLANLYQTELEVKNNIPISIKKNAEKNKKKQITQKNEIADKLEASLVATKKILMANTAIDNNAATFDEDTTTNNKTQLDSTPTQNNNLDNITKEVEAEEVKSNSDSEIAKVPNKVKVIKSPIYPGCRKKKSELDKKKCFTSKMYRHVQRKFNSDIAQNIGLKRGVNKIRIHFVIDKNGDAIVLKVRTANKDLEKEAIRVIQSLPKMIPGNVDGKNEEIKYSIPISFMVED